VLSPLREPALWCEAGAEAYAEWAWELRSETIYDFGFTIYDFGFGTKSQINNRTS
jgi:hypothetical protein